MKHKKWINIINAQKQTNKYNPPLAADLSASTAHNTSPAVYLLVYQAPYPPALQYPSLIIIIIFYYVFEKKI